MANCESCGRYIDEQNQFGELIECPSCHETLGENDSDRVLKQGGKPMFKTL